MSAAERISLVACLHPLPPAHMLLTKYSFIEQSEIALTRVGLSKCPHPSPDEKLTVKRFQLFRQTGVGRANFMMISMCFALSLGYAFEGHCYRFDRPRILLIIGDFFENEARGCLASMLCQALRLAIECGVVRSKIMILELNVNADFADVSCPIAIYPAVSAAERISFRQINRNTGNRLRQQLVDAVTGETVDSRTKARGYQVGDSSFLPVEDEELEVARQQAQARRPGAVTVQPPAPAPIREAPFRKPDRPGGRAATPCLLPQPEPPRLVVENTRTIDIERFVPRGQIDARYIEKPYYIAPRDAVGQEAFAVIRDALERKQLVGIGRVILQSRERPIALEPMGKGLRGVTLRYAHEVLEGGGVFRGHPGYRAAGGNAADRRAHHAGQDRRLRSRHP